MDEDLGIVLGLLTLGLLLLLLICMAIGACRKRALVALGPYSRLDGEDTNDMPTTSTASSDMDSFPPMDADPDVAGPSHYTQDSDSKPLPEVRDMEPTAPEQDSKLPFGHPSHSVSGTAHQVYMPEQHAVHQVHPNVYNINQYPNMQPDQQIPIMQPHQQLPQLQQQFMNVQPLPNMPHLTCMACPQPHPTSTPHNHVVTSNLQINQNWSPHTGICYDLPPPYSPRDDHES